MNNTAVDIPSHERAVIEIIRAFENLSPDTVEQLGQKYAPHARFKDPFNHVQGRDAIRQIFRHMFANLRQPRFVVTRQIVQDRHSFLIWEFHFYFRRLRAEQPQCIKGGTHLELDADGLITLHRDYWDAAEELYEKLPVIGALMRGLKARAKT